MGAEMDAFLAVQELAQGWARRNQTIFPLEVKKRRIGVTNSLHGSFAEKTQANAGSSTVTVNQYFDDSGRYVDMGVGNGNGLEGKRVNAAIAEAASRKTKGRKPKKWMRIMFARLNALQGAIGIKVMESGIKAIKGN